MKSRVYYVANCIERILCAAGNDRRTAIESIASLFVDEDHPTASMRHHRLIELCSDWESTAKRRRGPAHPDQE